MINSSKTWPYLCPDYPCYLYCPGYRGHHGQTYDGVYPLWSAIDFFSSAS